ncbi:DUF2752 domain-containing protein [Lentisphaerota bacterium ZTH]|nr:DUF2752 domain-containing protein [Lentisphaerota bacterium]WET06713.1 DUF2752 domain-containing protein [Lentisphaerota bacterium ZTH]
MIKNLKLSQALKRGFGTVFLFEKAEKQLVKYPFLKAAVIMAAAVAAGFLVYLAPYFGDDFLPDCQFNALTGLHCPGCGCTRSLTALIHGNIAEACRKNLFAVAALPFVTTGIIIYLLQCFGVKVRAPFINGKLIFGIFILIMAFFILRNIPVFPFNLLAPH